MAGKLTIVPTPLGNLGDMTQRALDALRDADTVCAEDTRVTGKLLASLGIEKRLERLDENRMGAKAGGYIARMLDGESIAYCTDAGMPGVSDPGLRLVAAAREAQVAVEVLPGPSAAVTAYVTSGFTNPRYYFGGFFPRKKGEQAQLLESVRALDAALVFYESPKRLIAALDAIAQAYPHRQVCVCRELTKLHEEVVRGPVADVRDEFAARAAAGEASVRGEIVLVVDGPCETEAQQSEDDARAAAVRDAASLAAEGMRAKDIARHIAAQHGIARNDAYDIALSAAAGR